jgi:thiol-disulfide isomerase/thioredoxin
MWLVLILLLAVFLLAALGCSPEIDASEGCALVREATPTELLAEIATGKPVLVDFYKGSCPTCVPMESVFARLSFEYRPRGVTCYQYKMMTPTFGLTDEWVFRLCPVLWYPTIVLFVGGKEVYRWPGEYHVEHIRPELDARLPH